LNGLSVTCDAIQKFRDGDTVKVIIVKEDKWCKSNELLKALPFSQALIWIGILGEGKDIII
jgi:hypothetical protein